jgi:serine/threonine-protein kinase
MHAHAQESPPPPSSLQRALPAALESAILKAMEKDPSRRFQTAAEFRHALLKHRPATTLRPAHAYGPMPVSAAPRRDSRVIAGIALDALLLAMLCALIYGLGLYPDSRTSEAAKAARPAASAHTATTAQTAPTRRASSTKQTKAKSSNRSSAQGLDALREAWGQ